MRKALILAAGMGTRLRPLTLSKPKCLVEVHGTPILGNTLNALQENGYDEVAIVVGYLADEIIEFAGNIWKGMRVRYYEEKDYDDAGVVNALYYAREWLNSDCLLIEGDVFFQPVLLSKLQQHENRNCVAVSQYDNNRSATIILTDKYFESYNVIKEQDRDETTDYSSHYISSNIFLIKNDLWELVNGQVKALIESGTKQECYETILNEFLSSGIASLKAVPCDGEWYEIDNENDLAAAQRLFGRANQYP